MRFDPQMREPLNNRLLEGLRDCFIGRFVEFDDGTSGTVWAVKTVTDERPETYGYQYFLATIDPPDKYGGFLQLGLNARWIHVCHVKMPESYLNQGRLPELELDTLAWPMHYPVAKEK